MGGAFLDLAITCAAIMLLATGVVSAWTSGNAAKRVVGVAIAMLGALVAAAALAAPVSVLIVGAGVLFAQIALGVALVVRLQEAYGVVEIPEIDAADAESEPREQPR